MKQMKNRLFLILGWILCVCCSLELQAQTKEAILVDGCRPLLAPDCVVDDIVEEVEVLSQVTHTEYDLSLIHI